MNTMEPETWISGYIVSPEALNPNNTELFALRKRQFYFFNSCGNVLLDISDDAVIKFQRFLCMEDKAIIKDLIQKLNAFSEHPQTIPNWRFGQVTDTTMHLARYLFLPAK